MLVHRVSLLLLTALLSSAPVHAKRATPCPDGRFLLPDGTTLVGSPPGARDAVALAARQVGIDSGCAPRKAAVKPGKKSTRIGVRWPACGDRRKVRLKGVIAAPACDTLQGKLSGKKTPAVTFTATRSICGDGYADTAGGETCDGSGGGPGSGGDATFELLDAARIALAGGADDVPLSPDGTLRFRRTSIAGLTNEEIVRGETVLAQWLHTGDTSTALADRTGDGSPETIVNAARTPVRSATVVVDLDGDGTSDQTSSLTQSGADDVQAVITGAGAGTFTTTLLQEAGPLAPRVETMPCSATDVSTARTALASATNTGLACLRQYGLDDMARLIEGKLARDGVEFACDNSDRCAQVDILDGLTRGALPTALGITLGPDFFTGGGACSNGAMVLFHELLHVSTGGIHSPALDRSTFEGLATDRVYSCTDICFRPGQATKCECATCLGVDRCDPKCAGFADCPDVGGCDAAVAITATTCPPVACQCCQGPGCSGTFWTHRMEGTASGPVGATLRVNFVPSLGGELQCPGWTATPCPPSASSLNCCTRTSAAQPQQINFVATLPAVPPFVPLQCICPPPAPVSVGYVAQVGRSDAGAVVESAQNVLCPQ